MAIKPKDLDLGKGYKYGWHEDEVSVFEPKRGLTRETVEEISKRKNEPEWMTKFRLRAYEHFMRRPMPLWGADLSGIDFENIYYYLKPIQNQAKSWEELPPGIKETYDKLGIPEAERNFLGGVTAQYESEVVYHQVKKELEDMGVIFTDTDTALREHEDILRKHWATVIPPNDNKLAALNSAVWSGGSFIYVPEGVHVDI